MKAKESKESKRIMKVRGGNVGHTAVYMEKDMT